MALMVSVGKLKSDIVSPPRRRHLRGCWILRSGAPLVSAPSPDKLVGETETRKLRAAELFGRARGLGTRH
jgi:hypothetical protein